MVVTASFTDVARNFSTITKQVAEKNTSVTVFKNNKPFVKIVPVDSDEDEWFSVIDSVSEKYADVLKKMADE